MLLRPQREVVVRTRRVHANDWRGTATGAGQGAVLCTFFMQVGTSPACGVDAVFVPCHKLMPFRAMLSN